MGFFNKVTINMTSCNELKGEEDGEEDKQKDSPKGDDKTLTVLEALPEWVGGKFFSYQKICISVLLLTFTTQSFVLIRPNMLENPPKALPSVTLAIQLSLSLMMTCC